MENEGTTRSGPRLRPLLIYDGDCHFCRRWVARWQQQVGEQVDFAAYQSVAQEFPQIPRESLAGSVHLIDTEGRSSRGAEAVFRLLYHAPGRRWMLWSYRLVPGLAFLTEAFYRLVARHRGFFTFLTRVWWGAYTGPIRYRITRSLFIRGLGVIYFIAFVSLGSQILGLVGEHGILPVKSYLEYVRDLAGAQRVWAMPTLCWIRADDSFLVGMCGGGAVISGLVTLGLFQGPGLLALWILYLSLSEAGQAFLGFQWDALLLETGLLAVFFAPWSIRARLARDPEPSRYVRWMLWLLLFKLMFSSGIVKLLSGDPAWRNLTALTYHYETQPLTTWTAWYVHLLPFWFQRESCRLMFIVELFMPFLIFAPRRFRLLAGGALGSLQILIAATGNYTFFNGLSILLCLSLWDDSIWPKFLQARQGDATGQSTRTRRDLAPSPYLGFLRVVGWVRRGLAVPVLAVILLVTTVQILGVLRIRVRWPPEVLGICRAVGPLSSVNHYGLFAVMTKSRPEIIVEGSLDGRQWRTYEFKWKPGDPRRRPEFVAPHQPRLDWQMWFAALGRFEGNPWFENFLTRLLQGSPPVLALLKNNPFPTEPPRYIRAIVYDYHFTDWETHRRDGAWWRADNPRPYSPVLSLRREEARP